MDYNKIKVNLAKLKNQRFRANYNNFGYDAYAVDQYLDLAVEINTNLMNDNLSLTKQLSDLTQKYQEHMDTCQRLKDVGNHQEQLDQPLDQSPNPDANQ